MRDTTIAVLLVALLLCGCSGATGVVQPDDAGSISESVAQSARWNWGSWIFSVDADHTRIEAVPVRESNLHFNVLKFVESPECPNCLMIGAIQPQEDGTFKVKVKLSHPFPGHPEYTGFDVRGTVVFPATHYWTASEYTITKWEASPTYYYYDGSFPLWFSRASEGGAELLNADGYSFYLFPGFFAGPDIPICRYQTGQKATGTPEELDSTVNPYIEFHNVEDRRMFTCYGQVQRTYHIKPPAGAFKFGYIVDASWAAPVHTPVTDPAQDFPEWANAEEGYSMGATQIQPLVKFSHCYNVVEWTIHHRANYEDGPVHFARAYCPSIPSNVWYDSDGWGEMNLQYRSWWDPGIPPIPPEPPQGEKESIDPRTTLLRLALSEDINQDTEPGNHLALLVTDLRNEPDEGQGPAYFNESVTLEFIDLYVE